MELCIIPGTSAHCMEWLILRKCPDAPDMVQVVPVTLGCDLIGAYDTDISEPQRPKAIARCLEFSVKESVAEKWIICGRTKKEFVQRTIANLDALKVAPPRKRTKDEHNEEYIQMMLDIGILIGDILESTEV